MINQVKLGRVKNNMTQSDLAEKVNVSRQTIYAIEQGNYNLSIVLALKIASVFDTSIHDLFELEANDW